MEPSIPSSESSYTDESNDTLGIIVPEVNADLQAPEDERRQPSPDKAEAQSELETARDSPDPLNPSGVSDVSSEHSSVTESTDAAVKTPDENTDSHNSDGSGASDIDTSSESTILRTESPDGSTVSSRSASDDTVVVVPFRRASGLIKRVTRWICRALLIASILLLSLCCVKDSHPFLNHLAFNQYAEQTCHVTKVPLLCSSIVCHVNGLLYRVSAAVVGQGSDSSGRQLATEFSQTYSNLSQVVAANNILYQVPHQMRSGRMDLRRMKKRLPPASTAHEPIDQFLVLSLHRDQNLSDFTHMISRLGKSALMKHAATNETLATVRQSPLVSNYIDSFVRAIGWKNVQEKRVQRQLKSNLDTLRPGVDHAYLAAGEQLQAFSELRQIAADIRLQIGDDRARFGQEKSDLMKEHHFVVRVMIKAFGSPEPRKVLHLTQALVVADELVDWTTGSEKWLGKLVPYLADVKGGMDALSDALHGQDRATRWGADDGAKLEALGEFMMLVEEGVAPLRINARAYDQQLTMHRRG